MSAYYNENDPFAAQWLRNLIAAKLIADGEVDERSIVDVRADDLRGFTQCHFFAGIGGWSYALRLAGWPDDKPAWSGSCPCQSLSVAGKRKGHADKRHLWPAFYPLIAQCYPSVVFGEQSASKDGREWFSAVRADLEAAGYACGAVNFPAEVLGAPHERERIYFVADAGRRQQRNEIARRFSRNSEMAGASFANRARPATVWRNPNGRRVGGECEVEETRAAANGNEARRAGRQLEPRIRASEVSLNRCSFVEAWQGWNGGFGGFGRLDDGVPKRVAKSVVGGFGNAIVPQVAAQFIIAASEAIA